MVLKHMRALAAVGLAALVTTGPVGAGTCGNGVLEPGETCEGCARDCVVRPCIASPNTFAAPVTVALPRDQKVSSVTVLVAYRSDVLSLPGKGADESVRTRISGLASDTLSAANNVGYALRVVVSRSDQIAARPLLTVTFDRCQGASEVSDVYLACTVEHCGSQAGVIDGCGCAIEKREYSADDADGRR